MTYWTCDGVGIAAPISAPAVIQIASRRPGERTRRRVMIQLADNRSKAASAGPFHRYLSRSVSFSIVASSSNAPLAAYQAWGAVAP